MNRTNDVEKTLRSWAPRRPSANLEARIFGGGANLRQPAGPEADPECGFGWGWLAPVTAALLVLGGLSNHYSLVRVSYSTDLRPTTELALSNQSLAAWLPGSFTCEQNRVPGENFEWTNGGRSTSSISSLSGARGND